MTNEHSSEERDWQRASLLAALERHEPGDDDEARARDQIVEHVRRAADPFDRASYDAHVTGSAFVIDARGEHLLLLFHRKLGRWLQPGGHGEPGERDPLAIATREAHEETGIAGLALHPDAAAPFDLDVHVIPARPGEPAHRHLDVRYLIVAPEGAQPRHDPAEARAIAWVPLADAAAEGGDASVVRAARKIAALLAPSFVARNA